MSTIIPNPEVTNTEWRQIASTNAFVDNKTGSTIYWVGSASKPSMSLDLYNAHEIRGGTAETIALDQAIWARSKESTFQITVTEF